MHGHRNSASTTTTNCGDTNYGDSALNTRGDLRPDVVMARDPTFSKRGTGEIKCTVTVIIVGVN